MLKHGRFMANLQVCPIYPKPIEPVEEIPDNESGAGSQEWLISPFPPVHAYPNYMPATMAKQSASSLLKHEEEAESTFVEHTTIPLHLCSFAK